VAIYLFAMTVAAGVILAQYIWGYFTVDRTGVIGPGPEFYLLPPLALMALFGLAGVMLITDMEGPLLRGIAYTALAISTLIVLILILGVLETLSISKDEAYSIVDSYPFFLGTYAFAGVNGTMYFFLRQRYSRKPLYKLRVNSAFGLVSIVAIAGFVIIIVPYIILSQDPVLSYSMTGYLPNSFFAEPVLDSPAGIAFLTKYPDAQVIVNQYGLGQPDVCCSVGIVSSFDEPRVELSTKVNVDTTEKNLKVILGQQDLYCRGREGDWPVSGAIIQNLHPQSADCWDNPPAIPSDAELVEMAKSTDLAKEYFAKYPDNQVSIKWDNTPSGRPEVTFTPVLSEPIQYVVSFMTPSWEILQAQISCSNGDRSSSPPADYCSEPVHRYVEIAARTKEVKAFFHKYPDTKIHGGGFPEHVPDPTIKYVHRGELKGGLRDEAQLVVTFEGRTDMIANFEITCYKGTYNGTLTHTISGKELDVTSFLQDSYCP
jgi:hypothetical protein